MTMLQHPATFLSHFIKSFHLSGASPLVPSAPGLANILSSHGGMNPHPHHLTHHNGMTAAGGGGYARSLAGGSNVPSAPGTTPAAAKLLLQKLPLRVFRRLEEIVNRSSDLDWKHFDAGVVKVLGQLAELSDEDVTEELDLLNSTDLSSVEYMPAYLNKRLNNRLWSKRKLKQQQQQGGDVVS